MSHERWEQRKCEFNERIELLAVNYMDRSSISLHGQAVTKYFLVKLKFAPEQVSIELLSYWKFIKMKSI